MSEDNGQFFGGCIALILFTGLFVASVTFGIVSVLWLFGLV